MKYWIKERHNTQLGIYYIACGKLAAKEAKKMNHTAYGQNVMLGFDTKKEYETKIAQLVKNGHSVTEQ